MVISTEHLNHRDTETQRRRNQWFENKTPSCLLCASVSLWFNSCLDSFSQELEMSKLSRRSFAKASAAALAAPMFVHGRNLNDKMNIAMIAVGGRGGANLGGVKSENITV